MATARHKPVTIQPRADVVDDSVPASADVRPNAAFTLVHYHGWDFDEEVDEWFPRLNEVRHAPGCNGVRWEGTQTNGRPNPVAALTGAASKGGVVISPQNRALGEFTNYLAAHKVREKGATAVGFFYCLRNVEVVVLGGGRSSALSPDVDWLRRFKRHLYEHGIVPRMPREVLDTKVAMLDSRLSRYRALFNAGKVTIESFREKQKETEDLVRRYTAAYAKVAADEIPSDEAPASPVRTSAPALVPADPALERAIVEATKAKAKAPATRRGSKTLTPAKPPTETP